ncbi:hypothetical protein JCM16303_000009 [Sporobolomyces ruberrimus]
MAKITPLPPPKMPIGSSSSFLPRLSFTQGVLLGQLSMVILAVLFLRYVVFEDPDTAKKEREAKLRGEELDGTPIDGLTFGGRRKKRRRARTLESKKGNSTSTNAPNMLPESAASILNAISYDLSSHSPESLDWLNVLIAQLLSSYRLLASNHLAGGARGLMEEALNRKVRPAPTTVEDGSSQGLIGLDEIEVEEVELGEGFPELSNARVRPSGNAGEGLRVEVDLDYSDKVSLSLSTRVVMNFPRPRFAVLPVSLSLTLQRFSGTVTIELPTPSVSSPDSSPSKTSTLPHPPHQHPSIHLSLHPDFTLDLSTSSLLGSRAKLEDVPKVEQLLIARIRAIIQDRVVWPGRVEIGLPGIHPHHSKKHSTDGGADDLDGGLGGENGVDDWTVVDRPHPLACANENLPPFVSMSDFKHRNADSDTDEDEDDPAMPIGSPLNSRRANLTSTPPLFTTLVPEEAIDLSRDSTPSAETPSVDFSDPSGPTISLHPKIRKQSQSQPHRQSQSNGQGQKDMAAKKVRQLNLENLKALDQTFRAEAAGGGGLPPSPTESFPGYFPGTKGGGASGGLGTAVGFNSAGGTRYRGIGGVGLSSR